MNRYERLIKQAKCGDVILMDGATGTEVARRGVKQLKNAWIAGGALSNPDIVQTIHEDYINCDAKIITSNTFATSKHALKDAGVIHNFSTLNDAGVKLCIEARNKLAKNDVLVAGGISYWPWADEIKNLCELSDSIVEQASIMATAGADLLMLEMMVDIEKMMITFNAAKTAGLPVWVGLTCEPNSSGVMCLREGDELSKALDVLIPMKPDVILIMHTEVEHILPLVKITQSHWTGLLGVYAHSGTMDWSDGIMKNNISPEKYRAFAEKWKDAGVNFIGGCCGIGVDHMTLLSDTIHEPWSR